MFAASSRATETRTILALAWPVVLTSLNWTLLQVTDIFVVGFVSSEEVAALGASRTLTFIGIVAGLAWLSGVLVESARADGAGNLTRTGQVLREGLVLSVILGLISGGILFFLAAPLLSGIGVASAVVHPSAAVVRVMALAYPFQMIIIAASYFLEGISRPRRVMVVNLAILPLNALLAWALSGGHLGLPQLGAVGAALATAIASVIGAAAIVAACVTLPGARDRDLRLFGASAWRNLGVGTAALARFGLMPAIASGLELAGFSILIALSTQLGATTAHAFQIVFSIHNVTFAVALGLGSAAGVRVGNAVGAGHPEAATFRTAVAAIMAVAIIGILAIALAVFAAPIAQAFPADRAVHLIAIALLPVWAPFIIFDGLQVVFLYALRSLGDQVAAGINGIVAFFLVTGGVGYVLVGAGYGPLALVYGSGFGMLTAALLHGHRFYRVMARYRRQRSA